MTQQITIKDLEKLGIIVKFDEPFVIETDLGNLYGYNTYRKLINGKLSLLKPIKRTVNHKYGKPKVYYNYTIQSVGDFYKTKNGTNKKYVEYPMVLPISRVYYCAKYGIIKKNMDIDHINNNTFDNRIENLQELTRKENLAKRMLPEEFSELCKNVWKKRMEENKNDV